VRSSAARSVSPRVRSSFSQLASSIATDVDLFTEPDRRQDLEVVVELRQYALRPGQRETLIGLFDSVLVEAQEAEGMAILGVFRDLDRPDRFVWLRGFPDMDERARSLERFYDGPVWREHRDAANATMLDSDDVLLLRPARGDGGFALDTSAEATIAYLDGIDETQAVSRFAEEVAPTLGDSLLGCFVSERSENTFPRLPVREGEDVLVWFSGEAGKRVDLGLRHEVLRLEPASRG
jgi:hypothetical protein